MLRVIIIAGIGIALGAIGVSYLNGFQKGFQGVENKQISHFEPQKSSQSVREAA